MKQSAYLARGMGGVLVLALSLVQQAWATNDPANGKALYTSNAQAGSKCSTCHTTDPAVNQDRVLNGSGNPSALTAAFANFPGDMGNYQGVYTASELSDLAAYLSAVPSSSPTSAALAAATGGSANLTFTITNPGGVYYKIANGNVTVVGAQASEFTITGNTCNDVILSGPQTKAQPTVTMVSQCTVQVTFTPTSSASHSATLQIAGSPWDAKNAVAAGAAAASVSVSLTGSISGVSLSPNQVTLAYVAATGSSAASWTPTTTTLTNNDPTAATINTIHSGSTHVTLSGTCQAGNLLPAGASCTIDINADAAASTTVDITTSAGNQSLVVLAQAPPATSSTQSSSGTNTSATNAGAGGCTIAGPHAQWDPLWLAMVLGATALSAWRHRPGARARKAPQAKSGQ
jgi:cytochrome c553